MPRSLGIATDSTHNPPRTVLIACRVLEDEITALAEGMSHLIAIEWLPQGLHDEPHRLRTSLQVTIDAVEERHRPEVIVLAYGLCSRGIERVTAKLARLVIARAHDCITLLLGSKERYAKEVERRPGTYWYSPGWNRHHLAPGPERYRRLYDEYRRRYGEDNATYLMNSEQRWFKTYDRAVYVYLSHNGRPVGPVADDTAFTKDCAEWLGWSYERMRGDELLLRDLLAGRWDGERFCVAEPGEMFQMSPDEEIVRAVPAGFRS